MQIKLTNEKMSFEAVFDKEKLTSVRLSNPNTDFPLFSGWDVMLNDKKIEDISFVNARRFYKNKTKGIRLILKLQDDIFMLYTISIKSDESYFDEHVKLLCKRDINITSFCFNWVCENSGMLALPIPFAQHDLKPCQLSLDNATEYSRDCEGLLLLHHNVGVAIAKKPSDKEPVWICLSNLKNHVSFGGASCGFYDGEQPVYANDGDEIDFRITRYIFFNGTIEDGCYQYRDYMASCGVKAPDNFNPPINYCIYYEYPGHFTVENLGEMADVASSLGCELLYTDQGWETSFGSGVWDEKRLGKIRDIVSLAENKGLKLGVLVPHHLKEESFSEDAYLRDENGNIRPGDPWNHFGVCPCSVTWQREKLKSLKKLSDGGVGFFSFDFNNNDFPCYSKEHGHSVPIYKYEHVRALAEFQKRTKKLCPNTLVEAHDWIDAGAYHYPIYMFSNGHHERWGFEYMWKPLEDYRSGRVQNLYYYNLSYEKPLYLHMNLNGAGENAEVFWYYASTIRHLGFGNFTHLSDEQQQVIRNAVAAYKECKDYFAGGRFIGKNPLIHAHVLQNKGAVITVFSDDSNAKETVVKFSKNELTINGKFKVDTLWGNAAITLFDDEIEIKCKFDGFGASVVRIDTK